MSGSCSVLSLFSFCVSFFLPCPVLSLSFFEGLALVFVLPYSKCDIYLFIWKKNFYSSNTTRIQLRCYSRTHYLYKQSQWCHKSCTNPIGQKHGKIWPNKVKTSHNSRIMVSEYTQFSWEKASFTCFNVVTRRHTPLDGWGENRLCCPLLLGIVELYFIFLVWRLISW